MKSITLSALGKKARDGFCRCGSGASTGAASSCSGGGGGSYDENFGGLDQLAAAKLASVNKLARLLGEEVKSDDKVLFDHCPAGRSRRNAFPNIFCGLPSRGLRRLFAVYGIDEVQTKAPYESLDLDEEARRERQHRRELRAATETSAACRSSRGQHQQRCQLKQQKQNRAHSAMDPSRRRLLPAFASADNRKQLPATGCGRH